MTKRGGCLTRGELLRLRGSLDFARDDGALLTLFFPNDTAFLLRSFCLIVQKNSAFSCTRLSLSTPTTSLSNYARFIHLRSNAFSFSLLFYYPLNLQRLPNSLHSIYPCFIQGLVSIFIILSSHLLNLPFSHPVIFIPFLFIYRCYNMLYL